MNVLWFICYSEFIHCYLKFYNIVINNEAVPILGSSRIKICTLRDEIMWLQHKNTSTQSRPGSFNIFATLVVLFYKNIGNIEQLLDEY